LCDFIIAATGLLLVSIVEVSGYLNYVIGLVYASFLVQAVIEANSGGGQAV